MLLSLKEGCFANLLWFDLPVFMPIARACLVLPRLFMPASFVNLINEARLSVNEPRSFGLLSIPSKTETCIKAPERSRGRLFVLHFIPTSKWISSASHLGLKVRSRTLLPGHCADRGLNIASRTGLFDRSSFVFVNGFLSPKRLHVDFFPDDASSSRASRGVEMKDTKGFGMRTSSSLFGFLFGLYL